VPLQHRLSRGGAPSSKLEHKSFAKFVGQRIPHTAASVKGFDIVCLQEVFDEDGKSAIAEAWVGQKTDVTWNGQLERDKEKELQLDGAKVRLLGAMPNDEGTEIAVLRQGTRYIVAGPDSWCPDPITGIDWETTQDGGLMLLTTYPIVAASGMIWSDQTGVEELGAKGALYARIQLDPENSECYIHVFNTHLAARDPEFTGPDGRGQVPHPDQNWKAREKQIEELVTFISNCIRDDKVGNPIILCGDFNVIAPFPANWGGDLVVPAEIDATKAIPSPQYDELIKLLAAHKLTDAWKEKLAGMPGFTWLGNDWQTQPGSPWEDKGNPLATEPGWPQRLDYILYNAGTETSPITLRLDVIDRTRKAEKPFQWNGTQSYILSDHLGVIAKFTVSPKQTLSGERNQSTQGLTACWHCRSSPSTKA
jgi:endonuclease/exonuclease/phosphatase family metal-dependent hydrolase